jgi:phosphohistidine phosphatase SixA
MQIQQIQLTIVRHGETVANASHIIQGQSPDPSFKLTELGASQAQVVGKVLQGRAWWKVLCSDLPRTRETVSILWNTYTSYTYIHTHIHFFFSNHTVHNLLFFPVHSLHFSPYDTIIQHDLQI